MRARVSWLDIDERPCRSRKYQSLVLPTIRQTIWPMIIPGRGLKSSLKNERAGYVRAWVRACVRVHAVRTRLGSQKRVMVVVVPNITIAAKLQRPVLLARERPRVPQNHNTTPYKIQYDAAAGRHLSVTATTSSSRHPRSWLIATRVRRARVIFQSNETPPF